MSTMNQNAATTKDGYTFQGGYDQARALPVAPEIVGSAVATDGSLVGPQRVMGKDGDIVTLGTEADTAWALTGNGTIDAILKAIALVGGTTADAAYASGNGSLVALLKGVFARLLFGTQTDANGYLFASLGTAIAGEDVTNNVLRTEEHATANIINANTVGTLVKSGPGYLYGLTVGDPGSAWVISIYDNTSATGTPFVLKPTAPIALPGYTINNGIFVVASGTTAGTLALRYR